MSDGFANAVVGGAETLIRSAIKSFGYGANVFGWRIARDGNAEFNNGAFRGSLIVASPSGSNVNIFADATFAEIDLQPPDTATVGVTFGPAQILTTTFSDEPELQINGPTVETPGFISGARLSLAISAGKSSVNVLADLMALGPFTLAGSKLFLEYEQVLVGPDQVDIGRGLFSSDSATADSAANAAEFEILNIASVTYKANRLYRLDTTGRIAPAAAAQPLMQVRKTNLAGAIEFVLGRVTCAAAQEYAPPPPIYFQVGGSDVTTALSLTLNGGGVSTRHESGNVGRSISIWDVGAAASMPNVVTLT